MDDEIKEQVKKKRKEQWVEAWFAIEALAVDKAVVEDALKKHIEKLSKAKDTFVYESSFAEARLQENPMKGVDKAYSQIASVRLFLKDIFTLLSIVVVYGPSSIEIIGPEKKEIKIDEMQNMANVIAGIVHQFASAGVGGIVISPGK